MHRLSARFAPLVLGALLALTVAVGAPAAPTPTAGGLLLPSVPGLSAKATSEPLPRKDLLEDFGPDQRRLLEAGQVDGRVWTDGGTNVVEQLFSTDSRAFALGMLAGTRQEIGTPGERLASLPETYVWRKFVIDGEPADVVQVIRGGSTSIVSIIPSGSLSDAELASYAAAQRDRLPNDGAEPNTATRVGRALGRLIVLPALILGTVFTVRAVRRRRSASSTPEGSTGSA